MSSKVATLPWSLPLDLRLLLGHLHGEDALLVADHHGDLTVRSPIAVDLICRLRAVHAERRYSFSNGAADKIIGLDAEEPLGRKVGNTDNAGCVETDDARADG